MVYKIAIDGPAGSGKSTIACLLRNKLKYKTINSGSIYRSVAYILNKKFQSVNLEDKSVVDFVNSLDFDLVNDDIFYLNENISPFLRSRKIDEDVSLVAKELYIRKKVGQLQHKFISNSELGIIIEGRDIGTHVLPDAILKIYLNAKPEVRAKRRFEERSEISYEDTLKDLLIRDINDKTRKHGALTIAEDAIVVNTDELSTGEVVEKIYNLFRSKIDLKGL